PPATRRAPPATPVAGPRAAGSAPNRAGTTSGRRCPDRCPRGGTARASAAASAHRARRSTSPGTDPARASNTPTAMARARSGWRPFRAARNWCWSKHRALPRSARSGGAASIRRPPCSTGTAASGGGGMVRSTFAVLLGLVVALAAMLLLEYLGMSLFPLPPGFDLDSEADLARLVESAGMGKQLWVLMGWTLAAFAGGWVAARTTLRHRLGAALWVGGLIVAGVLLNVALLPHPAWM